MTGLGLRPRRDFGKYRAFGLDAFIEGGVLFRVDNIDPAALHGQGPGRQRATVRGRVDAPGQARNHQQAAFASALTPALT